MATRADYTPDTTIDLDDFIEKATDEQCFVLNQNHQTYVGDPGTTTGLAYPHLHVWRNGTIALSVASGRNTKVGKNGVINISDLSEAALRFNLPAGPLRNTIGWVLASAS
ncbi:MAG: hypothetical protein JO290_10075 [Sphingomonadaceae bacterium]|nr:hypothetical protein [Sphingomonadaceae bacterium]